MAFRTYTNFLYPHYMLKFYKVDRTFLYIDGTNLLAGLVDIFGYKNLPSFGSILKEIYKYHRVDRIFFYASYTPSKNVRNIKVKKQIGLEIEFFRDVRKQENLTFYKGYRSPSSKKEKGVDVHLATDMVKDAFLKKYSKAVILSGDADFEYCVEIVRNLGLPVYAFFLPNRFSLAIAYKTLNPKILNYKQSFKNILRKRIKKLDIVKINRFEFLDKKDLARKERGRLAI